MALTDKQFVRMKLQALKQIGNLIGMYGKFRKPPSITTGDKYLCLDCIKVIQHSKTSYIQKSACAAILDYFIPEWRTIVGNELLGHIADRNGKEVRAWRKRILKRDSYKCSECESPDNLEAHHIAHWAEYPELRLDDDNGITLCNGCHAKQHVSISGLILSRAG